MATQLLPPGVSQRSDAEAFAPEKLGALYAGHHVAGVDALTLEQRYNLDVSGFVVLSAVLTPADVAAALAAPEPWADGGLALRPVLTELLGDDWRLDTAPGLLPQLEQADESAEVGRLVGGGGSTDGRRLRYWDHHGPRRCLGLRVVLALGDVPPGAGGLTLLPASHKSLLPVPHSVSADVEASLAAPLLTQPALVTGDVLLLAGSLARSLRVSTHAIPTAILFPGTYI